MSYNIYSTHAPTGESSTTVVSSNPYYNKGREIGFPSNLDLYTRLISDSDGSQSVTESRKVTDLLGSRLYLHHRPLIGSNGTVTSITVSDGTLDTSFTNAKQGYVVFSSLPSADFTVTYVAVPDCDVTWNINVLQDSVMELQQFVGPTTDTGYAGLRTLKIATFDNPGDSVVSGVLQNAVQLSHLNQNIVIASSDDAGLKAIRGSSHTIQVGRATDNVIVDATGFTITQSDGTKTSRIVLGTKTGDVITYKGSLSGEGQMTIGGPAWAGYSGQVLSTGLTGSYYSGSMLRVHGDVSVMGNIKAVGNITIVNTTGTTSTVMGDFTVRDELFVNGESHLIGKTNTNILEAADSIFINKDIIALDTNGSGGEGQSLVDGLDCSEIALSYRYVTQSKHGNSIISAPIKTNYSAPIYEVTRPWKVIPARNLVGDVFALTGQLNAAASISGAHPNILQLLLNEQMVSGTYNASGTTAGLWSPGMMEPGTMWVKMLSGPAQNSKAPIYGYTVENVTGHYINRLNVFLPDPFDSSPQTNDYYLLYNPHSIRYNTIEAAGGASPTFTVKGTTNEPFAVSFENEVRVLSNTTSSYSLSSALTNSVSGLAGSVTTGIAYIYADANYTDPEDPPIFKAKAVPMRMPGQTAVGEVVAYYSGSSWTIVDTISYRPGGKYDSAWIPIYPNTNIVDTSGRVTPGMTSSTTTPRRLYFNHYLGADVDISNISATLYLGNPASTTTLSWNKTHVPLYSMFGQDIRAEHGLSGTLMSVPLGVQRTSSATAGRDAAIFYIDSSLIGVDINPGLLAALPISGSSTVSAPSYLRLVINKLN